MKATTKTTRRDLVKELNEFIRKTDADDVVLKYGYNNNGVFVESDVDVNLDYDKRETVLVKYDGQSDMFGIKQSIEMDGLFSIVIDVVNAIKRL